MQKIDTIELLLSQLGYVRSTQTIGYHITLSRSISSFKHYLKPKDSMDRFISALGGDSEDSTSTGEGVLTAKRVHTSDSFLTHSVQYGETKSTIEMPYRIKEGITGFLESDISNYQQNLHRPELDKKPSLLLRLIMGREYTPLRNILNFRNHDLFNTEDGYINLLNMYVKRCTDMVAGDAGAVRRFAILMEISGFRKPEDLALIAKDTTDEQLKMFLNFLQANSELEIEISDFKHAYNVFTMVDKNNFLD